MGGWTRVTSGQSSRKPSSLAPTLLYADDHASPANVPPGAINLGQGFMDWSPPSWIREKSHESIDNDVMANHYSHPRGRPRLLKAISKHYSSQFPNIVERGKELALDEIVVTAGANCGMLTIYAVDQ
jgi:aspartate/methionine/tyrosine aminotransferase